MREELCNIFNNDKSEYKFDFLDKVSVYINSDLLELYYKVLDLSIEAPFDEELKESYLLGLNLLLNSLGLVVDTNNNVKTKED